MSLRFTESDYQAILARQQKSDPLQTLIEEKGFVPAETVEQRALARYLDLLGVLWCHVPNEGKRKTGGFMVGMGLKKGCPDVLIFSPPPNRPDARGVAVELKRVRGGKVSPEQEEWLYNLEVAGWITRVCQGADDAIKFLRGLGWR